MSLDRDIPGADRDAGLYVNEPRQGMPGTRVLRLERGNGGREAWVHAMDFMRVQQERDDARRVLALLNALRARGAAGLPRTAARLLEDYGLTRRDAEAMASIVRQVVGEL